MISARFVLQRDEFVKAYRLALRNLPTKIRWAGWAQWPVARFDADWTGVPSRRRTGPRFFDHHRSGLACIRYGSNRSESTDKRSIRPHDRRGDLVRV